MVYTRITKLQALKVFFRGLIRNLEICLPEEKKIGNKLNYWENNENPQKAFLLIIHYASEIHLPEPSIYNYNWQLSAWKNSKQYDRGEKVFNRTCRNGSKSRKQGHKHYPCPCHGSAEQKPPEKVDAPVHVSSLMVHLLASSLHLHQRNFLH